MTRVGRKGQFETDGRSDRYVIDTIRLVRPADRACGEVELPAADPGDPLGLQEPSLPQGQVTGLLFDDAPLGICCLHQPSRIMSQLMTLDQAGHNLREPL